MIENVFGTTPPAGGGFGGRGGSTGAGDPPEDKGCPPRESAGDTGGMPDLGNEGEKASWDPETGKLYKDPIRGDKANDPDSPFGNAEKARADGIDLKPWPPDVTKNPDGSIPGFHEKGHSSTMCGWFSYVHYNLAKYSEEIARTTGGWKGGVNQVIDTQLVECMVNCARSYGNLPNNPMIRPQYGIPWPSSTGGKDHGARMLERCKEECMYSLLGIIEKLPKPKYPLPSWQGRARKPPKPLPDFPAKTASLTCPPFSKSKKLVIISISFTEYGKSMRTGFRYQRKRGHLVVGEILECNSSGMKIRCYESRYQAPGGYNYVIKTDPRGNAVFFKSDPPMGKWKSSPGGASQSKLDQPTVETIIQ